MPDNEESIWLRSAGATTGRPATRSREQITAVAVALADERGIEAVSMRNIAEQLGTGAASLYRYVGGRDDLLALMIDSTAGEYRLKAPTGEPVEDLIDVAHQMRSIMLKHFWLPNLVLTRPALGPQALVVLDHVLEVLADVPLSGRTKLETFAVLNATVATFAMNEHASKTFDVDDSYMHHVVATGEWPRITELVEDLSADDTASSDRRMGVLRAVLLGLMQQAG